jgi:hypothetical protein
VSICTHLSFRVIAEIRPVSISIPRYFVNSIGVDEETVKKYVEHQGLQDSGQLHLKL